MNGRTAVLICVAVAALVLPTGSTASAEDGVRVGHTIKQIVVPGSRPGEMRHVDVHLWYPADATGFADAPKTVYRSALYGVPLIADRWDPLSWQVEAQVARENVPIESTGIAFPVIVFSHGATNDPIDYAYTLERIAGAGFVVAAPAHVNNTQDDVRIDYVNAQAVLAGFPATPPVLTCRDELPPPCVKSLGANVARSMADRVRDVSRVLDALPGWYGDRVDVSRAGAMGHSRGTVTALTAAGGSVPAGGTTGCGSAPWNIVPEPRIQAVMGLAIGAAPITFCANFANVTVPALLIAGSLDVNSAPAVSKSAYDQLKTTRKEFVLFDGAVHRSFDSTYCSQLQAAGARAQGNARAILDRHTVEGIVVAPISGVAMDYCSLASFTSPVDIRALVTSITAFDFAANTVPRTTPGETEAVRQRVQERAVAFFGGILKTPPLIGHSISGTFGTNGWYVSDVAVTWTVTDPESDITSSTGCDAAAVTADTGGVTLTCKASSAGGSSLLDTPSIKRDATAPTVSYSGNTGTYGVTDTVSITCTPDDNLSGVATSTCSAISADAYTFAAGANTFGATAVDNAGNLGSGTVTFTLNVTASGLCELTREFLRSSTSPVATRARAAVVNALSAATCARLSTITPQLTPEQKARAIRIYGLVVHALVPSGWLTAPQAAALTRLAAAL